MLSPATYRLPVFRIAVLAAIGAVAHPALAITYNLVYRGPGSANPHPNATNNTNDPNGTQLTAIMQVAANRWSDIVEDGFTMDIDYFYGGTGTIPTQTANANIDESVDGGSRTKRGTIQFYDSRVWYFDPTPNSDTEYDMVQTLLGDLPASVQASDFSQGIVATEELEIGYRGAYNGTDVTAGGGFDILSTALHEMGHLMGVTNQLLKAEAETEDGDYDLPSSLIGGNNVGVNVTGTDDDIAHLLNSQPLLSGVAADQGIRRDISATDVFTAAKVSGWTQIDLRRQDYLNSFNTNFANASNWEGNSVPGPTDFAYIRHGGNVSLTANDVIGNLLVAEGSRLSTGTSSLFVQGTATLGPSGVPTQSRLVVNAGGAFTANNIDILSGEVQLSGGQLTSQGGFIDNNAIITGNGTIRVGDNFSNAGTLRATGGGTIVISELQAGSGAKVDLDGQFSTGTVDAVDGSIDVNMAHSAFFSGTMTIGRGQFVDLPNDWQLSSGNLMLNGGATQAAELRGGDLEVGGDITVDRKGLLDVAVEVQNNGTISVPDTNDELTFNRDVTYIGGTHTGNGKHIYNGRVDFQGGTLAVTDVELVPGGRFDLVGGTLSVVWFDGDLNNEGGNLAPNGEANLSNRYIQRSAASMEIEIGGLAPTSEFDQVNIAATADLGGTLEVLLTSGFTPSRGNTFEFLTAAAGIDGQFQTELLPALSGGLAWDVNYTGQSVFLEVLAAFLEADFDEDGDVDGDDFLAWQGGFGTLGGAGHDDGDANADGAVDGNDFLIWQSQFGSTAGTSAATVPEPGASALLLLAIITGLGIRRRAEK